MEPFPSPLCLNLLTTPKKKVNIVEMMTLMILPLGWRYEWRQRGDFTRESSDYCLSKTNWKQSCWRYKWPHQQRSSTLLIWVHIHQSQCQECHCQSWIVTCFKCIQVWGMECSLKSLYVDACWCKCIFMMKQMIDVEIIRYYYLHNSLQC